jgi:hypothetical protein
MTIRRDKIKCGEWNERDGEMENEVAVRCWSAAYLEEWCKLYTKPKVMAREYYGWITKFTAHH